MRVSHGYLFRNVNSVAVKVDGRWRFYSPGDAYVPYGMLRWQEEGVDTLLADPKAVVWVRPPSAEPSASVRARHGELRLDEDGELEGDIAVELTGHFSTRWKEQHWENTGKELSDAVRNEVTAILPNAEVTDIGIDKIEATSRPMKIHYHLRVPDFAVASGGRIIFVPNIFTGKSEPRYRQSIRTHPIVLPFGWTETENFSINLPAGYELDVADCPGPINIGDGIFTQSTEIGYKKKSRQIDYSQKISIGAGGRLIFETRFYPAIKNAFEVLNAASAHVLILRRVPTESEKIPEPGKTP